MSRRLCPLALPWLLLSVTVAQADVATPSASDFGEAGLLQTPTARMFDEGEVALSGSYAEPYIRGSLTLQPLPWVQGNIRYTNINNREYDATHTISTQSYKDKGFDVRFRLLEEGYYQPALAVGLQDLGGTGLFASEYVVVNKRFWNVDLSLGMAWGYLGARGDMQNPLSLLFGDQANSRPAYDPKTPGGNFNVKSLFRGNASLFGGVEYQTPWQPLIVKVEYEGNDYASEPLTNPQPQQSRINAGLVWRVNRNLDFQTAFERGNTFMAGFTLHENYGKSRPMPKLSDPKPVTPKPVDTPTPTPADWQQVSRELHDNAGYQVSSISRRSHELVIRGEQQTYAAHAEGIGRVARILDNHADYDVHWFTVVDEQAGMPVKETSLSRDTFRDLVNNDASVDDLRRTLSESVVSSSSPDVLFQNKNPDPFTYGFGVGYKQSLGGPDSFILYQFTADASVEYHFTPQWWWSSGLSVAVLDNYDKFVYDGPSLLPRVRTDVRQYLTSSNVMIPVFQFSHAEALDNNVFGMVYAGMLETMYGGAGGEVLYRPFGEPLAWGIDVNWVKQRGYEQDFSFRPYQTVTGHLSTYWDTGFNGVLVITRVGRYLAKDWGMTLDVSRSFDNGVRMGGYVTRTDVSAHKFGEGSFDKGIYISIPFDIMLTRSTLNTATINWSPLTRDGGAALARRYNLYDLTNDRDLRSFHRAFEHVAE